jgi:hypothetical protein
MQSTTEIAMAVRSKQDLERFISALIHDNSENFDEWSNLDLPSYLSALKWWISDMEGFCKNFDIELPDNGSWQLFALALNAATDY